MVRSPQRCVVRGSSKLRFVGGAVTRVGQHLRWCLSGVDDHPVGHRNQVGHIGGTIVDICGDDDLMFCLDRGLGVET